MTDPTDPSQLEAAAAVLRQGGLVAFPTETVYGLGADATNAAAVARVFAAKGRPATNPLIAHVADVASARVWTPGWSAVAEKLATAFWPGPLTLVLPRHPLVCDAVAAGGDSVGLRVPNHPVALALLRRFDRPVAAPSANRANRISPTTARHVHDELGGRVDLVLDGGPCGVGIESTVLDLTTDPPTLLRPGGVSRDQLRQVVELSDTTKIGDRPHSPGQGLVHYAPRTPAFRFDHDDQLAGRSTARSVVMSLPADPVRCARDLYATLRELDAAGHDAIFIPMPPDDPAWAAVRDRLTRATRPISDRPSQQP